MTRHSGLIRLFRRFIQKRVFKTRKRVKEAEYIRRFPDSHIHWSCEISKLGTVSIGYGSYMGEQGRIYCWHPDDVVEVGKFTSIANHVLVVNGRWHGMDKATMFPVRRLLPEWERDTSVEKSLKTVIGNDVWIATRATILGGITVGHGAAVAAGAVVAKDVEPYTLVGGVPAKVIRERLPRDKAEKMLEIAWWDWPLQTIMERVEDLEGPIDAFIDKFHPE